MSYPVNPLSIMNTENSRSNSSQSHAASCAFPEPPVRRSYCMPAAYQQVDGSKYHKIVHAYGSSRSTSTSM